MENESFNNKILDKIHTERIKPKSRWLFTTEHWFFITVIAVMTFVGSIAVATTLFILTDHDWFAVQYLNENLLVHILKTIPYVWLVIVGFVIILMYINVKKINRGYRIQAWKIVLVSLLASLSIGTAFYLAGFGGFLDNYLDQAIPTYRNTVPGNRNIWKYPERGLLSGKVSSIDQTGFVLTDDNSKVWDITVTGNTKTKTIITVHKHLKITGEITSGSNFTATEVLPWKNERK